MAKNVWLGGATPSVAEIDTFTPANVNIGNTFTLTATGEDGSTAAVNFVATVATVANVTAGLTAAWNASTNALHTTITAADTGTAVTLTADTAGVPFSVASSATGGTATLTRAATTANVGPKDFNTAANWAPAVVPVNGDEPEFNGRATDDLRYGLNQSAKTFATLKFRDSFTRGGGAVGGYKLKCGATAWTIGEASADGSTAGGSAQINLFITGAGAGRIVKTRSSGTSNLPPVQVVTDTNTHTITVEQGRVGIGTDVYGETVTLNALSLVGSGRVEVGEGVSFAGTTPKLNQTGGSVILRCAVATIEQDAGSIETAGAGTITTAQIGGTFIGNSTGTITTLEVKGSGSADFSKSTAARTITNATIVGPGAKINSRTGIPLRVVFTNGVDFIDGALGTEHTHDDEVNAAYSAA